MLMLISVVSLSAGSFLCHGILRLKLCRVLKTWKGNSFYTVFPEYHIIVHMLLHSDWSESWWCWLFFLSFHRRAVILFSSVHEPFIECCGRRPIPMLWNLHFSRFFSESLGHFCSAWPLCDNSCTRIKKYIYIFFTMNERFITIAKMSKKMF